jgi:uncharacterized protein YkwD
MNRKLAEYAGLALAVLTLILPRALVADPAPAATPPPVPPQSAATAKIESEIIDAVNVLRRRNGVPALKVHARLTDVARDYSRRMAIEKFFSLTDPQGKTVVQRCAARGVAWSVLTENVAWTVNSADTATQMVNGWLNSPASRANLLKPQLTDTGVGIWYNGTKCLCSQVLMRPK